MSEINDRNEQITSSGNDDINNDTLDAEITLLESTLIDFKEGECNDENYFTPITKPLVNKEIPNEGTILNAENALSQSKDSSRPTEVLDLKHLEPSEEENKLLNSSEFALKSEITLILPTTRQIKSTDDLSTINYISKESSDIFPENSNLDCKNNRSLSYKLDQNHHTDGNCRPNSNQICDVDVNSISHVRPIYDGNLFYKLSEILTAQNNVTPTDISEIFSHKGIEPTCQNYYGFVSDEKNPDNNFVVEESKDLDLKNSLPSSYFMLDEKKISSIKTSSMSSDTELLCKLKHASKTHSLSNSSVISQELNPYPSMLPNKEVDELPACISESDEKSIDLPNSGAIPLQSTETPESVPVIVEHSRHMLEDLDRPVSEATMISDHEPTHLKLENPEKSLSNGKSQSAGCSIDPPKNNVDKKETPAEVQFIAKADSVMDKSNKPIYCSTPVVCDLKDSREEHTSSIKSTINSDFGLSPLTTCTSSNSETNNRAIRNKMNLKRRNLGLECIEEIDEDLSDGCLEKKLKLADSNVDFENKTSTGNDADVSSSVTCFEAPAKSILKKWQPSGLPKNSSSAFLVLDECGESESEELAKPSQDSVDDFESEFNFLTEELLKGSHNIEVLEKYHSQVQLESQMDDEKFDELMQELNCDLDEKTFLSIKQTEESFLPDNNASTLLPVKSEAESSDNEAETCIIEPDLPRNKSLIESKGIAGDKICMANDRSLITKTEDSQETLLSNNDKQLQNMGNEINDAAEASGSKQLDNAEEDILEIVMDEEDFLLAENDNTEKKPYVFFEFISNDPKENEDNYNPEWQKLGKLTSDEERYKAVRDRWRSLVPPDPNRDLTCRQWRKKNNLPPLNIATLNNNHRMEYDTERNQLCTAVFEKKIKKMFEHLGTGRRNIIKQRNIDFENLAIDQDKEQRRLQMRGGSDYDLAVLHRYHIEQCRQLKDQHDAELVRIRSITDQKVRALREASEEVLLFQQFYKGVGTTNDEVCMYMTDVQVQELMETEEMLERYTQFYN